MLRVRDSGLKHALYKIGGALIAKGQHLQCTSDRETANLIRDQSRLL
jgi:hypothetical protein